MTRKDYVLIADCLKDGIDGEETEEFLKGYFTAVAQVSEAFEQDNSNFDVNKFKAYIGENR